MVLIWLIWCAGLASAAQFGKVSVSFEALRGVYGGSGEVALGLVVSVVGLVGLVFGTTAGLIVQRLGPKRCLVAALVLGAVASAVQVGLPPYPLMIATRVAEGLSHLAIVVAGPTMIAGLASEANRGFAMTLWSSFFAVAYAGLAVIAPLFPGPEALFAAHGVMMAGLAGLLARALPRDAAGQGARRGGILAEHGAIYASPRLAAPAMGFFFYTFLYVALLTLLPPATPAPFAQWVAVGAPLASIAVSLTFGVRALRYMSAVRLVQAGYVLAVPGLLALWVFWGQGPGMVAAAFAISAALGIVQGASFATIPELNPGADDRARAAGAIAQLGNLGTTTGTPILAALLAGAGAGGLVLAGLVFCAAGVGVHALQARRR